MSAEMKRTSAVALGALWSSPDLFLQLSSISVWLCCPGAVTHLAMSCNLWLDLLERPFAVCGAGETAVC